MNAVKLYDKLNTDFILDGITDDWKERTKVFDVFLTKSYKKTSMGLMFDFTDEIKTVYSAVFLSEDVVKRASQSKNAMILVHHPLMWDLEKYDEIFAPISIKSVKLLKVNNISVFNMHTPLDNYSDYSTSKSLAETLGLKIIKPFAAYFGTLAGVICETPFSHISELKAKFEQAVGHQTKLYNYGDQNIKNRKVAVVAGGGNDADIIREMVDLGITTLITGVSLKNDFSKQLHEFEKKNNINILGGTHYSTEKFAMISMCKYFEASGINSEFIEESPSFSDL